MNNFQRQKIVFIAALVCMTSAVAAQPLTSLWPIRTADFLQGFERPVSGEVLNFLPGLTNGQVALLVRATDGRQSLQFQSAVVPENYDREYVSLVWSAAISRRLQEPPGNFSLAINDNDYFSFTSHKDSATASWTMRNGKTDLSFVATEITKQTHDAFGYMFLNIPTSLIKKGERISIRVAGGHQNSQDWYMPFGIPVINDQEVLAEPALVNTAAGLRQRVRVEIRHAGVPAPVEFRIDKKTVQSASLKPGKTVFYLLQEPVTEKKNVAIDVLIGGKITRTHNVELRPVRKFEVYFLPHSHVDIGFTHRQDDVEKLQWRNFELAIDLAEKTKDYPDGSRFKWNAEITWAVDGYLKHTSEEKRKRFLDAVKQGWIGLDALYASQLTGLQREEEMINNQRYAIELKNKYGFDVTTAMISDVPGYIWGTVESLAQSGVKYFSSGPNHMPHLPHGGYQVGYTLETWGDVPFYWTSASGKQKVLFWMTSHGYSWFHSWSIDILSKSGGDPVIRFLDELDKQRYPYDIVQLRYTIGNDNGPPDETMPDFIRRWNETYAYPKLRIATNHEMMAALEKRYGNIIPTYSGDLTPYWEDGAASSALETGINRKNADRLIQAETLALMLGEPEDYTRRIDEAWRNVLLFSEHTWGANISKSQPDSEFTKDLWKVKQAFALDGERQSVALVDDALKSISASDPATDAFMVLNTSSWQRTNLVTVPASWNIGNRQITDADGKPVESQRLQNGDVAFVAANVPAFGSRKYIIRKAGRKTNSTPILTGGTRLSNGVIDVQWSASTGDITAITRNGGPNLIDSRDTLGFNAYWYGGLIRSNLQKQGGATIEVIEQGPVLGRVRITTPAPGAESLVREIQVVKGLDEVFLTNIVDKKRVLEDENVRFTFPFNIPGGQVRIDIPWSTVRPETDQLKGANKNFFSVQRWVDISNTETGITLLPLEAPLLEIGDMYGQDWMTDMAERPWIKKYRPSTRLFSWVMNNTWFVNYKAHQEGIIPFHYILRPHGRFDHFEARKAGMEHTQPLLPVRTMKDAKPVKPLVKLSQNSKAIITSFKMSRDEKALMIRLFNPTDELTDAQLVFSRQGATLFSSSAHEEKGAEAGNGIITLSPWEVRTLRVEFQ